MIDALNLPVSVLNVGVRAIQVFEQQGITYVGDLIALREFDLLRFKYMGRKTLKETIEALKSIGLHLRMDTCDWKRPGNAVLKRKEMGVIEYHPK